VDLNDKVVGIIGNRSSAVQIIPAIFPSKLIVLPAEGKKLTYLTSQ
jgi:cation diffusion facilitator CzcD-associated flavoprotein CzcO